MRSQTNLTGGRGGFGWAPFLEGLRQGQPSSYFLLIGLVVLGAVVIWAGTNALRKDTGR